MTERSISRDSVVSDLVAVFRDHGYGGASLARLAAAASLRKPTLYYHFPGGKEEMAEAVLDAVADWFETHVFAPLAAPGPPTRRIDAMRAALNRHFDGGAAICLFARFALGATRDRFQSRIGDFFGRWISALAQALIDDGQDPDDAVRRAADAVMAIEGAVTLSRALDDTGPFHRALRQLPEHLAVDLPPDFGAAGSPAPGIEPAALDDRGAGATPPSKTPSPIDDDDSVI